MGILFSVGYHLPGADDTASVTSQDGFISSLLVLLLLLAVKAGLLIATWLDLSKGFSYLFHVIQVKIILSATVSTVIALILTFSGRRQVLDMYTKPRRSQLTANEASHALSGILRSRIPLVGIVVFYILSSYPDLLLLVGSVHCVPTFLHCRPPLATYWLLAVLTGVLRIFFKTACVLFCLRFHDRKFVRSVGARYCVMFICAAILGHWFLMLSDMFFLPLPELVLLSGDPDDLCGHSGNLSLTDHQCLHWDTSLLCKEDELLRSFIPFDLEFSLLFSSIALSLFCSMSPPEDCNTHLIPDDDSEVSNRYIRSVIGQIHGQLKEYVGPGSEYLIQRSHNNYDHNGRHDGICVCDYVPFDLTTDVTATIDTGVTNLDLGPHAAQIWREISDTILALDATAASSHDQLRDENSTQRMPYRNSLTSGITLLGILYNLIYVALALVGTHNDTWRDVYLVYQAGFFVTMLLVCLVSLAQLRHFKPRFHGYKPLEMILLFISLGNSLLLWFTIVAVAMQLIECNRCDVTMVCVFFVAQLTDTAGIYLQVALMCHVARVENNREPGCCHCFRLRLTLLYLFISNFALWVTDSFVEYIHFLYVHPMQYGSFERIVPGFWRHVYGIILPFLIFFRFNASFIFLEVYLGF